MKNLLLLFVLLLFSNYSIGQKDTSRNIFKDLMNRNTGVSSFKSNDDCGISTLELQIDQSEYQEVDEPIVLTTSPYSWLEILPIEIPFEIERGNLEITDIELDMEFMILQLGSSSPFLVFAMVPLFIDYVDWAYELELEETSSPVFMKILGDPGNQIAIIEFQNLGLYYDESMEDYANFQVWVFEELGTIEYHYGDFQISNPAEIFENPGPLVGMLCLDEFEERFMLLVGDPLKPSIEIFLEEPEVQFWLDDVPPNGTIYRFIDNTVSVHQQNDLDIEWILSPNPFNDKVLIQSNQIDLNKAQFLLYNMEGKLVESSVLNGNSNQIDLPHLLGGLYYYVIRTQHTVLHSGKLVKE